MPHDFNLVRTMLQGWPQADSQPVFKTFVVELLNLVGRAETGRYTARVDCHKMAEEAGMEDGPWYIQQVK